MQMTPDFSWDDIAYWQHYKGGRYILVEEWHGTLEEDYQNPDCPDDLQRVVIYKSLDNPSQKPWVRRYGYFFGDVKVSGNDVPRFTPITWREAYKQEEGN